MPAGGARLAGRAADPAHPRRRRAQPAPGRGRPVLVVVVAGTVLREGRGLAHRLPPGHPASRAHRRASPGRSGARWGAAVRPCAGRRRLRLSLIPQRARRARPSRGLLRLVAAFPRVPARLRATPSALLRARPPERPAAAPSRAAPPAPGAPSPAQLPGPLTGSEASRRLLSSEDPSRPITLWGSPSMSSEGGDEATPVPIRIHEHLILAAAPATVHAYGVGATTSAHTLLMRGLDRPVATPSSTPETDTGTVTITLDSGLSPAGPLRIPGTLGEVPGHLDGSSGSWRFTP